MTKEIIAQLKSRRAELMTELSRIERAIVALDAAPAQVAKKKPGRPKVMPKVRVETDVDAELDALAANGAGAAVGGRYGSGLAEK